MALHLQLIFKFTFFVRLAPGLKFECEAFLPQNMLAANYINFLCVKLV